MADEINTSPHDPLANLDRAFGERVRRARTARRMSQQEVADTLNSEFSFGWHQTTAGRVEAGTRPAKLAEAVAIARVLDVPLDELVYGTDSAGAAGPDRAWEELYQVQRQVQQVFDRRMARLSGEATDVVVERAKRRYREQQED